ncbi:uncharacterized protein EDB93DRAFT_1255893 [Suillus bovinus]|uniref:uncharacterized protein n=1 Tax=Suillus bovinus TaxID=48563 RepID=UPI001B86F747|nr:uncharacterized protein EDB93DRAFT_1255893 [Suillus bovinus]KAG2130415.1 hypothetical protein EDB93DRAFT_1255893 [Suillus bovinus]
MPAHHLVLALRDCKPYKSLLEGCRDLSKTALIPSAPPASTSMMPSSSAVNEEIVNMQSDMITQEELRDECYRMALKYNLALQVDEHKFLKLERAINHAEAAAAHKRGMEAKDIETRLCEAEIRLREAETKMYHALARAYAEEAVT